jgi:hypothetical protein
MPIGDMTTRLRHKQPREETSLGNFIFNPTGTRIVDMSEEMQDNRSRFMEAIGRANMEVQITWLQKAQGELLTYRTPGVKGFSEDPLTSNYAQIDHIVIKRSWRNIITDHKRQTHADELGPHTKIHRHQSQNGKPETTTKRAAKNILGT